MLKAKQPKAFLLENVRRLVKHDKGRTFAVILKKLDELGYHTYWKVMTFFGLWTTAEKRADYVRVGFRKNYPFAFPQHIPTVLNLKIFLNLRN